MKQKVIIIGPAHPLRGGGITSFNHRLCRQFIREGFDCSIFSFSLQYPSFLFPGKSQFTNEPAPEGITIYPVINSIHPLNWLHIGNQIRKIKPDLVIVRFWIPFMGPALGTILSRIQKNHFTRIIAITDNVIPHEKRPGDRQFTRYFLKYCDGFVTMGSQVMNDLRQFEPLKPAIQLSHPLYDDFGAAVGSSEAREHLALPQDVPIMLFFGFIRKYKGLDILLEAMKLQQEKAPTGHVLPLLLVAGEFYEDEEEYRRKIADWGLSSRVILRTGFIPDAEIKYYLGAADVVVQPYRHATQSGIIPLAYHFEKPMIVTRVGSLPEQVPDGRVGLVTEPVPQALETAIEHFFSLGQNYFLPQLRAEKEKYSWSHFVQAIQDLSQTIEKR